MCNDLFAQKIIVFNPSPDFFLLREGVQNVAAYENKGLDLSLNYKNRTGALSDIKDFYIDACLPLKTNQRAGLKAYSEQETSLFTKNKIDLFYAYTINFKNEVALSIGAQGGLANITFSPSAASAGGAAFAPDLSVSGVLKIKNFKLGLSAKQIPQAHIRPILYEFVLRRYYEGYSSYKFKLDKSWSIDIGASAKTYETQYFWDANTILSKKEAYGFLLKAGQKSSFACGAFVTISQIPEYNLNIALSYTNAYYPSIKQSNAFSIFMSFTKKQIASRYNK